MTRSNVYVGGWMFPHEGDIQNGACEDCRIGVVCLRRQGFHDTITWSVIEGPSGISHAFHSNSRTKLVCTDHKQAIAWVKQFRPGRPLVYLAHPVAGDLEANVRNAVAWVVFFRSLDLRGFEAIGIHDLTERPVVSAPWLVALVSDKDYPGGRKGVLSDCCAMVPVFDELWWVNQVSEGMYTEGRFARRVRDLTQLGPTPPTPAFPNLGR